MSSRMSSTMSAQLERSALRGLTALSVWSDDGMLIPDQPLSQKRSSGDHQRAWGLLSVRHHGTTPPSLIVAH